MKRLNALTINPLPLADLQQIWVRLYERRVPRYLFLLLCVNLIIAPAVQAATGSDLSRMQSYTLGLLGLVVLAYSIYLFVVMFQPERF
jgi:K+-transporting ATPase KdpF subunit